MEALLLDIGDRLKNHDLRSLALEVVQELTQVDETVAVEESALIEKIRQQFSL
jgi:HEPN domain-containing protein